MRLDKQFALTILEHSHAYKKLAMINIIMFFIQVVFDLGDFVVDVLDRVAYGARTSIRSNGTRTHFVI